MIDKTYEIFFTIQEPIKFIKLSGIVNIEWEDEERKMEVSLEDIE